MIINVLRQDLYHKLNWFKHQAVSCIGYYSPQINRFKNETRRMEKQK